MNRPYYRARGNARSSSVKYLVAQIAHRQDRVIRTTGRRYGYAGIFHFADKDRVIALLDGVDQLAFDKGRRLLQDRRTKRSFAEGFAADGVAFTLQRLEKGKSLTLLIFTQHV